MGTVSLIVMEHGSAWPGRVGDCEDVVAVHDDKSVLLDRTRLKLDVLRRRGQHLRVAVLACNAETDRESLTRRAEVAHELLREVSSVGFGRLLLSTGQRPSMPLRLGVLSLAHALRRTPAGMAATVNIRFGDIDGPWGGVSIGRP
jgi:hypothetical protein